MLADGRTERLSLLGVFRACVTAGTNQPCRAGGHRVATLVEVSEENVFLGKPGEGFKIAMFAPRPEHRRVLRAASRTSATVITVRTPLPLIGLFGLEQGMEVQGHAGVELSLE